MHVILIICMKCETYDVISRQHEVFSNMIEHARRAGFRHPGTYPKKPGGFFWVHPPKKPTRKKPTLLL